MTQRPDFTSHGRTLASEVKQITQRLDASKQDIVRDRSFIEIKVAPFEKLKDRYQSLLNNARINVLDLINQTTGYGVISKEDLPYLENRLTEYAESTEHVGKRYFSFIEELQPINSLERLSPKVRTIIQESPEEKIRVTIETFSSLPREVRETEMVNEVKRFIEGKDQNKLVSSYIHSSGSVVLEAEITAQQAELLTQEFDSIKIIELSPVILFPEVMDQSGNTVLKG